MNIAIVDDIAADVPCCAAVWNASSPGETYRQIYWNTTLVKHFSLLVQSCSLQFCFWIFIWMG